MINNLAPSVPQRTSSNLKMERFRGLQDIVVAFVPLLLLGIIGTRLGAGTFLGGLLITLGYNLSITVAWVVLKMRGSGWRDIGLARPQSWLRTLLLGVVALVGAVIVTVTVQLIAVNWPGLVLDEADVSRFNPLEGNLLLLLGYVVLAWTTIAFGEEMIFRAFLINR